MNTKKSARSLAAMGAETSIEYSQTTPPTATCQELDNISVFANAVSTTPASCITWQQVLKDVRSGKYRKAIEKVRRIFHEFGCKSKEYEKIKKNLPCITFAGTFRAPRNIGNILSTTGYVIADLDHTDDRTESIFKLLTQDKNCWFAFRSPSGVGIKAGIRARDIENDNDHKELYSAIEYYFKELYGLKIDPACKDISRLTFVSYDPDLWINNDPQYFDIKAWAKPLPSRPQPVKPDFTNSTGKKKYARKVLESCCEKIRQSQPGNQHRIRLEMSRLIGGYLQWISEGGVLSALEQAVMASGAKNMRASMKTIKDGLEYGKLSPIEIEDRNRSSAPHSESTQPGQAELLDKAKEPVIPSLLPVPVDAFPDDIQTVINSLVKAHGTTFEVAVTAVLAVSGSLIGWSRRLIAKEGWYVHAALYTATEAETGEGKSPTTDFLLKPVEELERQKFLKHKAAMEEYEMELREWQAEKKNLRGKPPALPLRKRYKMGDCTIESMADALDGNPKGLLWYREELNGLLLDLDKYTGKDGSAKSKLLEAYDLKSWQIDRVNKDRTTYIPKACLGLFGTIQPKVLFQAFDDLDAASGFLPRFIIIHSAKTGPTLWSDAGITDSMGEKWSSYVQKLASYELKLVEGKDAFFKSRLIGLSEDAKSEYIAWYNRLAIQPWNNVADGLFKAIVPKMQEQALRICLILHCLESIAFDKKETSPIQGDTMRRALRLADWVWSHQKRMWSLLNKNTAETPAPLEQRIAAAIIALETEIENSILLTQRITEKLNEGFEKKYHIKPESVGHACAKRLKLQRGPDKNNRGWIITPTIIGHLKSVYGLTAKITAITAQTAQNPRRQANADTGSYFATARTAQENTGSVFNCPTTARTLNPHQPREMGSMGSSGGYLPETSNHPKTEMETPEDIRENLGAGCSDNVDDGNADPEQETEAPPENDQNREVFNSGIKGVYLPEISNNPNIANQPDIFDNPPGNPEWQESLNSLIETAAPPEDDQGREVLEL